MLLIWLLITLKLSFTFIFIQAITLFVYNKAILLGIISKLYNMQGTSIIKAITIGNNIVQQKDINWSKRILGNEALAHMKTKIIIQDLKPKLRP